MTRELSGLLLAMLLASGCGTDRGRSSDAGSPAESTLAPSPDSLWARSRWKQIGGIEPLTMAADFVDTPPVIDGDPTVSEWGDPESGAWSGPFVDILGGEGPQPGLDTRVRVMWDEQFLYIAAVMEEPHLWATQADSTKPVWRENDIEVFIDPDGDTHDYLEVEVNAINTRNQVHFPRAYGDAGRSDRRAWFDGFRSAVKLDGTLNDGADIDRGWAVEMAFPWAGFERYGATRPVEGETWRMNFDRVNWHRVHTDSGYVKVEGLREENWTWTPQGVVLMHVPEMWGRVQFRTGAEPLTLPSAFERRARSCLLDTYYRGREFREATERFATSLTDLFGGEDGPGGCETMTMSPRERGFIVSMTNPTGLGPPSASIDHRRHLSFPATDVPSVDLRPD